GRAAAGHGAACSGGESRLSAPPRRTEASEGLTESQLRAFLWRHVALVDVLRRRETIHRAGDGQSGVQPHSAGGRSMRGGARVRQLHPLSSGTAHRAEPAEGRAEKVPAPAPADQRRVSARAAAACAGEGLHRMDQAGTEEPEAVMIVWRLEIVISNLPRFFGLSWRLECVPSRLSDDGSR